MCKIKSCKRISHPSSYFLANLLHTLENSSLPAVNRLVRVCRNSDPITGMTSNFIFLCLLAEGHVCCNGKFVIVRIIMTLFHKELKVPRKTKQIRNATSFILKCCNVIRLNITSFNEVVIRQGPLPYNFIGLDGSQYTAVQNGSLSLFF